ncbi:LacI family DNA-binding transcriptional regulator [Microvirga sp. G4-2]|uniref:LacI family DNA-binding transcriptional regulator n=1 Tax=Microvirga sp. G4-2 TaxID=3434467 RepID=UPI0040446844
MRDRKRVTIKDVAHETGLALSTVSNALAGKTYVSDETRALVRAAAEKLGYRASVVARALRMQRSFTIGVLIADVSNPSSADFVRGVEDVVLREKCTLLLCNTDGDEEKQLSHMRTLIDRQVDGMVLISQHCTSAKVRELLDASVPFVLVQRRSARHKDNYVGSDNCEGLSQAIHYAHSLGHRRIGFVQGPDDSSAARERLETFLAVADSLKLKVEQDLIYRGDYTFDSGVTAGQCFCAMRRRPTCILASSDINALGIIQSALDADLTVPSDLSVIGLDDISLASFRRIDLTTIQLQKRDIGIAAAELLMRKIRQPSSRPQQIVLPTKLIIRGSVVPPAGKPRGNARKPAAQALAVVRTASPAASAE